MAKTSKRQTGDLGEEVACKYLENKGFSVIERNYLRKWGEIDIIAEKVVAGANKLYFVEVKTVSYETIADLKQAVSRDTYRPEENVHFAKRMRLGRAIQTWITEHKHVGDFQIDVLTVRMVPREKYAVVDFDLSSDVIGLLFSDVG